MDPMISIKQSLVIERDLCPKPPFIAILAFYFRNLQNFLSILKNFEINPHQNLVIKPND